MLGRFRSGCGAPGLDPDPQWSDGPDDPCPIAGSLPGDPAGRDVDLFGLVLQAVTGQLDRIGAEGIRLDDLRPGTDVRVIHIPDEVRLTQIQLVVTHVDEHPASVQLSPHGPVEDVDPSVADQVGERGGHGAPRSYARFGANHRSASAADIPFRRA